MTELSHHAKKLYKRIQQGKWYPAFSDRTPVAMQELLDANLIGTAGRPQRIVACYVPNTGFTPYKPEKFEESYNGR